MFNSHCHMGLLEQFPYVLAIFLALGDAFGSVNAFAALELSGGNVTLPHLQSKNHWQFQ